jgi:hypothetical protein
LIADTSVSRTGSEFDRQPAPSHEEQENMKSGRQRREEILKRRRLRARIGRRMSLVPWHDPDRLPSGALPADQSLLVHDNTYGPRPRFYVDQPFTCVDCGKREVWTAADQKWWYEVAQGKIASRAGRCRDCRRKRRLRRSQERRAHVEGLVAKYGLEEAARRLRLAVEALELMRARWV